MQFVSTLFAFVLVLIVAFLVYIDQTNIIIKKIDNMQSTCVEEKVEYYGTRIATP